MDLITRIKNDNEIKDKIYNYLDDDQLRFIFIVILLIGFILILSGVKYAILFLVIAFGLLAFLVIFIKPNQSKDLIENFICQGFQNYHSFDEDSLNDEFFVSMIEDAPIENCQIKFRNSSRNKK